MATYKVIITDTIEAIVEAVNKDDALKYAREMNPTITTTYNIKEIGEPIDDPMIYTEMGWEEFKERSQRANTP